MQETSVSINLSGKQYRALCRELEYLIAKTKDEVNEKKSEQVLRSRLLELQDLRNIILGD